MAPPECLDARGLPRHYPSASRFPRQPSGSFKPHGQGAVKGVYLTGLFAQSRLSYREMDCPVRVHREMDCPVQWSLATPSALASQSRANQGSVAANPICKCRRHKAGHLQVRVAVGKQSTCVLKEAPLNKGPLGLPHMGAKIEHMFEQFLSHSGVGTWEPLLSHFEVTLILFVFL